MHTPHYTYLFLLLIHRVHTQFWADLNKQVNITKIENTVWAKMSAESDSSNARTSTLKTATHGARGATPAVVSRPANDFDSARPSSKDSSRYDFSSSSKGAAGGDDALVGNRSRSVVDGNGIKRKGHRGKRNNSGQGGAFARAVTGSCRGSPRRESKGGLGRREDIGGLEEESGNDVPQTVDETLLPAPVADKLVGVPGYDEVGHVPTLDEFRLSWPRMRLQTADAASQRESVAVGGVKGRRKLQGQAGQAQQGTGSAVHELSKRDQVFWHFKQYYDKADHSGGRSGDALFSAGVNATGLLHPDFDVIDAVGRHTAQAEEARCHSRIGEGVLLATGNTAGQRRSSGHGGRHSPGSSGKISIRDGSADETCGGDNGLTNVFRESMSGGEGAALRAAQDAVDAFAARAKDDANGFPMADGGETGEDGDEKDLSGSLSSSGVHRKAKGQQCLGSRWGTDNQRTKSSLEGSSTSAELQARKHNHSSSIVVSRAAVVTPLL